MGELHELFPVPDNLRHLPGGVELAPHPDICGPTKPILEVFPKGVVNALDRLIQRGRIDEEQACELLEIYLESGDGEFIVNMSEDQPTTEEPDPNQLTLF